MRLANCSRERTSLKRNLVICFLECDSLHEACDYSKEMSKSFRCILVVCFCCRNATRFLFVVYSRIFWSYSGSFALIGLEFCIELVYVVWFYYILSRNYFCGFCTCYGGVVFEALVGGLRIVLEREHRWSAIGSASFWWLYDILQEAYELF